MNIWRIYGPFWWEQEVEAKCWISKPVEFSVYYVALAVPYIEYVTTYQGTEWSEWGSRSWLFSMKTYSSISQYAFLWYSNLFEHSLFV